MRAEMASTEVPLANADATSLCTSALDPMRSAVSPLAYRQESIAVVGSSHPLPKIDAFPCTCNTPTSPSKVSNMTTSVSHAI